MFRHLIFALAAVAAPVVLTSCGGDDNDEPVYIPPVTQPSIPAAPGDDTGEEDYTPFDPQNLCDSWRLTATVSHNGKEYAIDVRFSTSNPYLIPTETPLTSIWNYEVDRATEMYPFQFYANIISNELTSFNVMIIRPLVEGQPLIHYVIAGMAITEDSTADTYEMEALFQLINSTAPEESIKDKKIKVTLVRE